MNMKEIVLTAAALKEVKMKQDENIAKIIDEYKVIIYDAMVDKINHSLADMEKYGYVSIKDIHIEVVVDLPKEFNNYKVKDSECVDPIIEWVKGKLKTALKPVGLTIGQLWLSRNINSAEPSEALFVCQTYLNIIEEKPEEKTEEITKISWWKRLIRH